MRTLLIIGILIALVGCTHEVALQNHDGNYIGKATLEFEGNSSGTISLDRNGVIYRGLWTSSKVDEGGMIASNYGIGSKKYKDYQRGWGNYLRSGESIFQSEQGDILKCEFRYRGTSAQGACRSETEMFEFTDRLE